MKEGRRMLKRLLLTLALAATAFGQNAGDYVDETIRSIVAQVNNLELELYKTPGDEVLMKKFLALVQVGNQKEIDVRERVERARGKNARLIPESAKHSVRITKIVMTGVRGDTATVYTEETSHWVWTHGPVFDQSNRPHTYHLKKFGTDWKVTTEEF